jgi:hypothetical protein
MEERSMVTASFFHRRAPASILALSLLVAGCSTASVTSTNVQKPTQAYTLTLGDITTADDGAQKLLPYFRVGFTQRIQQLSGRPAGDVGAGTTSPPDAAVVTGQILRASEGSAALRLLVGLGAGSAVLRAKFEIRDAAGNLLAQFGGDKSYAGNVGIGGTGFGDVPDMNALMSKFGAQIAQAAWRWSKGEPIEEPDPAPSPAQ